MTTSPVTTSPVTIAFPVEDRRTSFVFYHDGLGFAVTGEPAEDGLPEPLQFVVNDGLLLMAVPTEGFGWVTGDHQVAPRGVTEALMGLTLASPDDVDAVIARAVDAGGSVAIPAERQPWGYTGTVADPDGHLWMVTTAP